MIRLNKIIKHKYQGNSQVLLIFRYFRSDI